MSTRKQPAANRSAAPRRQRPNAHLVAAGQPRRGLVWGSIGGAALVVAILAYAVYHNYESSLTWQQKADKIHGIVDFRTSNPSIDTDADEGVTGTVTYTTAPPAYGYGNPDWQRCAGDVYDAQISNENAVHSLADGAVWITYDPAKLTPAQVGQLATHVTGSTDVLMSPYPGEPTPISLQAWGFQLRLTSPTDPRIGQFITDLKQKTTIEAGADCTTGTYITATGTEPHDPDATPTASTPPSAPAG